MVFCRTSGSSSIPVPTAPPGISFSSTWIPTLGAPGQQTSAPQLHPASIWYVHFCFSLGSGRAACRPCSPLAPDRPGLTHSGPGPHPASSPLPHPANTHRRTALLNYFLNISCMFVCLYFRVVISVKAKNRFSI